MKIIKTLALDKYKDTKKYKKLETNIYRNTKDDGNVFYCVTLYAELERGEDSQFPLENFLDEYLIHITDVFEEKEENGKRVLIFEVESKNDVPIEIFAKFVGKRIFTYDDGEGIEIGYEPLNNFKAIFGKEKSYKFNPKSKNPIDLAELEKFEKENKIKFPEQLRNYWLTFGDAPIKECNFKSDDYPTNLKEICFPFMRDGMKEDGFVPQTFYPIAGDAGGNLFYWNSVDDKIYMVFHDDIEPEPFVFFESVAEMFQRMEDCFQDKPSFCLEVPYNHPLVLQDRIQSGKKLGFLFLFVGIIPLFLLTILFACVQAYSTLCIVGSIFVVALIFFVVYSCTNRHNPKQDKISSMYRFFDNYFIILKNSNKEPNLYKLKKAYYYRKHENKQHVVNVYEKDKMFVLKMYTGTYNGSPVYTEEILPKNVFAGEVQRTAFVLFLRDILQSDYIEETLDDDYTFATSDYVLSIKRSLYEDDEAKAYANRLLEKYQQDEKQVLDCLLENGVREFYGEIYGYDDETIKNKLGKPTISIDMKRDSEHPEWKFVFAGHIAYCHSSLDEHLVSVEFVDDLKLSNDVQIDG